MKLFSFIAGLLMLAGTANANVVLLPADLPDLPTAYGETVTAQVIGRKAIYPATQAFDSCGSITGWSTPGYLNRTMYARTLIVANSNSDAGTKIVSAYVSESDVDNGQRYVRVGLVTPQLCTQTLSDGKVATFQIAFGEAQGGPQDDFIEGGLSFSGTIGVDLAFAGCENRGGNLISGVACANKFKAIGVLKNLDQSNAGSLQRASAMVISKCNGVSTAGDVCGGTASAGDWYDNCEKYKTLDGESMTQCLDALNFACYIDPQTDNECTTN